IQAPSITSKTVSVTLTKINRVLGISLTMSEVEAIFANLHFATTSQDDLLVVTVPSFRQDITLDVDLIEEIGKIYGFQAIFEKKQPVFYQASSFPSHPRFELVEKVHSFLLMQGLQEWVTCDLINPKLTDLISHDNAKAQVHIANPRSVEHSALRTSL